jgi:hypothetical protein
VSRATGVGRGDGREGGGREHEEPARGRLEIRHGGLREGGGRMGKEEEAG